MYFPDGRCSVTRCQVTEVLGTVRRYYVARSTCSVCKGLAARLSSGTLLLTWLIAPSLLHQTHCTSLLHQTHCTSLLHQSLLHIGNLAVQKRDLHVFGGT